MPTRRNPVVRYGALLRKAGPHTQSVSGKRHQSKRQLSDEIDDYFNQRKKVQRMPKKERPERERGDTASFFISKFLTSQYKVV